MTYFRGLLPGALPLLPLLWGGPAAAQSFPGPGNKLAFNGTSTYVDCGAAGRGITSRLTVEAWIRTTSLAGQFAVTKYSNSLFSESGFEFGTNNGYAAIYGRAGVGQYLSSGQSATFVSDGRWHHIVGQVDRNVWRIYVDGVLENSATYPYSGGNLSTPEPMTIGTYTYLPNFYFRGDIDEVRVWNSVRTQPEIQAAMCRKFASAPASLVAYYRFDQANGSTAADHGSAPVAGSLRNFPASPWAISGAPLGDASSSNYQNLWAPTDGVRLLMAGGDSAVVQGLSANTRGVQLYAVNSAPTLAPAGPAATSYVGVFTTASTPAGLNAAYSLRLRPASGPFCTTAYQRPGNDAGWAVLPQPPVTATSLLAPNAAYRQEYLLLPSVPTSAAITGDSALCAGASTQLTLTAPGSTGQRWSTGSTTPTLSVVPPGTYTVAVNYGPGCSRTLRRTVRAVPAPAALISGDSVLCPGRPVVLTASSPGATAYRWSTGATTAGLSVSQPGRYTVAVSYGPGCIATAARTVRAGATAPAFTLGADTTLCEGGQVLLQGPAGPGLNYQWSDNSTSRQLLVRAAGRYTLRVAGGCGEQVASRTITAAACLNIPNIITPNADNYNNLFVIKGLEGEGWALDIYSRWGQPALQTAHYHNDWGREAAPGLYYFLLRRPGTGYSYKGWLEVVR